VACLPYDRRVTRYAFPAVVLALGITAAGLFTGWGFARGRASDRYVEVKGLAEREVTADLALWPLRVAASAEDLGATQTQINRSTQQVLEFLGRHGIDAAATELQNLRVSDANTARYQPERRGPRFIIEQTVMVRSERPEVVQAASQRMSELVSAGVVLSSEEFGNGAPTFLFNGLNALKPAMIAEATANARAAAEQFARDSGSALGGIRQANQGVFVILARDQAPGVNEGSQLRKVVRVVSTVQYFLE
jgi:uncharacterized protein